MAPVGRSRLMRNINGEDVPDVPSYMRPRTEAARERDAFRYLHPWVEANQPGFMNRAAFPYNDDAMPEPEGCPDTALAALAQLGALRLHARRAFISLITADREYVLAEATKSMSLQYDVVEDPKDTPWLGTCSFMRSEGLVDLAVRNWRKARRLREVPEDDGFFYSEGVSPHSYIVCDVRALTEGKERAFVRHAPGLRFFSAVPLRDLHGSVIGSFTIIDDKPRYGISTNEMAFMEDMADTVTEHLEATIVRSQRQRSERLIQGLSLFNEGKDSLRYWWLAQDDKRVHRAGRYRKAGIDRQDQNDRLVKEFGGHDVQDMSIAARRRARRTRRQARDLSKAVPSESTSTTGSNSVAEGNRKSEHVAGHDFGAGPKSGVPSASALSDAQSSADGQEVSSEPREPRYDKKRSVKGSIHLAGATSNAFARASNLIREALSAEGVVFVDAHVASSSARGTQDRSDSGSFDDSDGRGTTASSIGDDRPNSMSENDYSDQGERENATCKLNGFSTRKRSTLTGSKSDHVFDLPETRLAALIRRYPEGNIFNYTDSGDMYSSSGDEHTSTSAGSSGSAGHRAMRASGRRLRRQCRDAEMLGSVMPGARTIAFYPVWDDGSERFRTCLFIWSTTPLRLFDPAEDMTYLSAFSHSLLAELARLETVASDKAKGTFISSVSHELRSPLHGVLAGAEFLMESELSAFQEQMAHTISMAGRTLLDTVNHILDFSKISNFSRAQRKERAIADATRREAAIAGDETEMGVTFSVDLARLTEEVVESVVSAKRFEDRVHDPSKLDLSQTLEGNLKPSSTSQLDAVSVTLDIARRENWVIDISPGSWTRVLTNLVSNALKYTREGTIAVRLSAGESATERGQQRGTVTLQIEDTGIGMSPQFLANGLYAPFKQVDSHSVGTGLGLSIVKQIANDIGAHLHVDSDLGEGTRVTLKLKAIFITGERAEDAPSPDVRLFDAVKGLDMERLHFYTLTRGTPRDDLLGTDALVTSVRNTARSWLSCEISSGSGIVPAAKANICAITESDLSRLAIDRPDQLSSMLADIASHRTQLLVLARSVRPVSANFSFAGSSIEPFFVSQAIGPRKLLRSIVAALASSSPAPTMKPIQQPDSGLREPPQKPDMLRRVTASALRPISPSSSQSDKSPSPATVPIEQSNSETFPEPLKVLLVEDNNINMKLLMALMKRLKLQFECALNGQEALDAYTASPSKFFLVLMDMSMPVMDGFTSTARIREVERKKKLKRCTIVALTGVSNSEARENAQRSGVDRYFTKPIRMQDVSALVADIQR